MEGFDGVGAGEEEPVVGAEVGEGGVEGGEGVGWDDLDGGDEDGGRAEGFELGGEVGGLVAGSGDEDAFVFEGHLVVIVVGKMRYRSDSKYSTMYKPAQFYPSRALVHNSRPQSSATYCGLTRLRRLCETPAYAIQRKSGICPGAEDTGAEHSSLSAGALADMDLGVFSGAGSADVFAVCAWVWTRQSGVAVGGLVGTGIAGLRGRMPGVEPRPYILRFDEDKPNPLYRRVCYTFAWNAVLSFALLNLSGLVIAAATGGWYMEQIYRYAYLPMCAAILLLGAAGSLPRVGLSTKGEGTERRYFYGSVWAVTVAQTLLLRALEDAAADSDGEPGEAGCLCGRTAGDGIGGASRGAAADAPHRAGRDDGCRLKLQLAVVAALLRAGSSALTLLELRARMPRHEVIYADLCHACALDSAGRTHG